MIGRHPDRWRLDAVGNPVLRVLNIITFSKSRIPLYSLNNQFIIGFNFLSRSTLP